MSTWTLIQIVFDIFSALGIFTVVMRMNRAPKDDPRLSRGLQLLQSKISVLEDLSDRTELQVNQLVAILENKAREVQAKVQLAEQHVHEIRVSMDRSLEVAKIFQDKIPHQEIIERQNTIKYVQAARLAHQGVAVEDIAKQIDLAKGEIEFIASVNKDRLMFSESDLPEWAKEISEPEPPVSSGGRSAYDPPQTEFMPQASDHAQAHMNSTGQDLMAHAAQTVANYSFEEPIIHGTTATDEDQTSRLRAEIELSERQRLVENLSRLQFEMQSLDMQLAKDPAIRDMANAFEAPRVPTASLQKLGLEFRKAVEKAEADDHARASHLPPLEQLASYIPNVMEAMPSFDRRDEYADEAPAAPARPVIQQPVTRVVTPPPIQQAAPPQPPLDPVLARAIAQRKVQEALARTAPAKRAVNPELNAARVAAKTPVSPVINGRGANSTTMPVIKRVLFPKIHEDEM